MAHQRQTRIAQLSGLASEASRNADDAKACARAEADLNPEAIPN